MKSFVMGMLFLAAVSSSSLARAEGDSRTITLNASASVVVPVDEYSVDAEIRTTGNDLAEVKKRNDAVAREVDELYRAKNDVQLNAHWLASEIDFRADSLRRQAIGGKLPGGKGGDPFDKEIADPPVRFLRRTTLRFDSLQEAVETLTKITALDAVRKSHELTLGSLRADVKNPQPHLDLARKKAVLLAREKAEILAAASGLKLGAAIKIADETSDDINIHRDRFYSDPFGSTDMRNVTPSRESRIEYVALQNARTDEKRDAAKTEMLLPSYVRMEAEVRIVFEATK